MIGAYYFSVMSRRRRVFHRGEVFCFLMVLFHIIVILAKGEPCSMKGMQNQAEYDACMSYRANEDSEFEDGFSGDDSDLSSRYVLENLVPHQSFDSVCSHTELFCFPPSFRGLLSEFKEKNAQSQGEDVSGVQSDVALPIELDEENTNISRSSDSCNFMFLGGRTISCDLSYRECYSEFPCSCIRSNRPNGVSFVGGPLSDDKYQSLKAEDEATKSSLLGSLSPYVEINPPLLDWGEKYLYDPSLAFLTVKNAQSDSTLTVFEPYGTNSQFYPCNFSETLLAPGETVSICVVFLPTWLGLSSAQFVLQTSAGGFLVQAKGFAVESPYRIQPLIGLGISSSGRWSKNLSLYNPYNEALHVEEVTMWTSISFGNNTHYTKAICNMNRDEDSNNSLLSVKEWLDVKGGEFGIPLLAIRPHRNWEIDPQKTETIIELDLPSHTEGEIFGAFCLHLLSSSDGKAKADTVVVPLKAELGKTSTYSELIDPLSLSIETVGPCAADGTIAAALLVRNDSPYILSIIKISATGEDANYFRIRYVEGLILFPSTATQVAVVTYTPPAVQLLDPLVQIREMSMNCKLLLSTNDSRTSEIGVACRDVVSLCSAGKFDSSIGHAKHTDEVKHGNTRAMSSSSSMQSPSEIKALDTTEADELVLRNWKSQATADGMSVLDIGEVVFGVIQVGSHHSQWITINNPSHKPILVQLVLNSWEIIDKCKTSLSHLQPSLSTRIVGNNSVTPGKYGFSLAENAVTEALLHPFGRASLGPILFQPANRCQWRSSILVRNNLSGVEWSTLKGSGGSISLVLLDESEPVQNLDFKLNMPTPLNLSSLGALYEKDHSHACSLSMSKELHAKNVGDFPLEVKKIEISGTECGTDGFVINGCKGFSLEPEESIKLVISYHTDFAVATIQRDLELALATGILVIPMKASLPICVLHFCKKSLFWMRVKKLLGTILFLASVFFLVLWCIVPQLVAVGSRPDYLLKSGKGSYIASVSHAGKFSRVQPTEKQSSKFVFSTKLNGLLRSIGDGEALSLECFGAREDSQAVSQNQGVSDHNLNRYAGYSCLSDAQKGMEVSSSAKSGAIQSSDTNETSNIGNLTVKIGKEKGRRRKKKKNTATALAGVFEVSSSHSGNSTPSSPLSPTSSSTPSRPSPQSTDVDRPVKLSNPFANVGNHQCKKSTRSEFACERKNALETEVMPTHGSKKASFLPQEKPAAPKRLPGKPVLLPSATFPCADKSGPRLMCHQPPLPSSSIVAPHLRAPGSKPRNLMTVKADEKMGLEEKFTYDIWGDHLSNLPLVGRSKEVLKMPPNVVENSSNSFFLRGPPTLVTNYQQITGSSDREG